MDPDVPANTLCGFIIKGMRIPRVSRVEEVCVYQACTNGLSRESVGKGKLCVPTSIGVYVCSIEWHRGDLPCPALTTILQLGNCGHGKQASFPFEIPSLKDSPMGVFRFPTTLVCPPGFSQP